MLYIARAGGIGGTTYGNGIPGGCGSGGGYGDSYGGASRSGGNFVSTNIVNGITTGPTVTSTYAVFGNIGGSQYDTTARYTVYSVAGGGGIGAAGGDHTKDTWPAGPGGAGLNEATINGRPYNFKSYFANNTNFGHNNNGYIGGGGSGIAGYYSTQADGGIGGGGKGMANHDNRIFATPGAPNTGSGGGSGSGWGGSGNGGSGIVIIRYKEVV